MFWKDRWVLAVVAVGLIVMSVTTWTLLQPAVPSAKEAKGPPLFMHCPRCEKEWRFNPVQFEKGCAQCGGEEYPLIQTTQPLAKIREASGGSARLVAPLLIEANIVLAILIALSRWRKQASPNEDFLYMECTRCHQRLRYAVSRIGMMGQCPRCKARIVFPEADTEDVSDPGELPWWQPRRWLQSLTRRSAKT